MVEWMKSPDCIPVVTSQVPSEEEVEDLSSSDVFFDSESVRVS